MPSQDYGNSFFGVNYSSPPHELPKGYLPDSRNVLPDAAGQLTGRSGSVALNSTSLEDRITSFFEFRSGSTTQKLCSYSTKIAYYSMALGEFVNLHTGLTSGAMMQWVNFGGKAICANYGNDVLQYYASTSDYGVLSGDWPAGKVLAEWSNRLWTSVGAVIYGSQLNDPTDKSGAAATATDGVSTTVGDSGDDITALFGYFDILLIGKKNNIYKLSGSPATDITSISIKPIYSSTGDNAGFTSPWAITQVGNDVIFLDGFDIKRLSGIQEFGDVEYVSIIPQFRDYIKSIADKDYIQYTQFFHYKKSQQIWVSIPTSATTHFVFVLDYKFYRTTGQYAFYPMYNLDINCFGGVLDGEVTTMYYGDETGFVHEMDRSNDDNGAAIERYFVTVASGNDPESGMVTNHETRKQFVRTKAAFRAEESTLVMTPSYALDLLDSEQVITAGNYTDMEAETVTGSTWKGTGVKQKKIPFFGLSGNTMALKWTHNRTNENFTAFPSNIEFQMKSKNLIV